MKAIKIKVFPFAQLKAGAGPAESALRDPCPDASQKNNGNWPLKLSSRLLFLVRTRAAGRQLSSEP
jgi:hypothetical protein